MDLGFDVVVTITGIVLVFLILVLLMAIITLEGKIFELDECQEEGRQDCCAGTRRKARCRSGTAGCARSSGRGGHPR